MLHRAPGARTLEAKTRGSGTPGKAAGLQVCGELSGKERRYTAQQPAQALDKKKAGRVGAQPLQFRFEDRYLRFF